MYEFQSQFQHFYDTNGSPLQNGYIYIGTVGLNPETNPITVYWDREGTLPAAQPIRTLNGYPSRSGSPARLYINVPDFSYTIRNSNSALVVTSLGSALFGSPLQYITNIAALRLLSPTSSPLVFIRGYSTNGDGGQGFWMASAVGAPGTYTDNGRTVIVPTGGDGSVAWLKDYRGTANIASLRTINPIVSPFIYVNGYSIDGDGGQGTFVSKTGSPAGTYVDNGGTIIVPTGGDGSIAWLRDYSGPINVKWFGAKGDGIADDTTPIQSALNTSLSVEIPAGTYLHTGLTLRYGQVLIGASRFDTWLKSTTNAPIITFGGSETGGSAVGFVRIEEVRLLGSRTAGTLQHGIRVVPQQSFITLKGVHIVACGGNGVDFRGTVTTAGNDQWHCEDIKVEQSLGYGWNITTQLATSVFINCETYANTAGGWNLASTSGKIENNLWLRSLDRWNEDATNAVVNGWNVGALVANCTWENCWCEANGNHTYPDTNRVSAGWKITTGANANLTFINPRCTVQSRGMWLTNSTTGIRITNPTFGLMGAFRSSADIIVDVGSVANIENPTSSGTLIISAVDGKSKITYQGIPVPSANVRAFRGTVYGAEDGTVTKILTTGATAGTFGGGTWAGTAGTNTITSNAGHSLRIGDHVQIPGAGTAGATLHAYITSMNATDLVATLDRNLITTVTVAAVSNGNREVSVGTTTPVISGAISAGTGTYSLQEGTYTIDEYLYCTYRGRLIWSAHTGTGTAIVPLPFSPSEAAVASIFLSNYTFGVGNYPVAIVDPTTNYIQLVTYSDGGAAAGLALDTGASLYWDVRFKISLLA